MERSALTFKQLKVKLVSMNQEPKSQLSENGGEAAQEPLQFFQGTAAEAMATSAVSPASSFVP